MRERKKGTLPQSMAGGYPAYLDRVRELLSQGVSLRQAARMVGRSHSTVMEALKRYPRESVPRVRPTTDRPEEGTRDSLDTTRKSAGKRPPQVTPDSTPDSAKSSTGDGESDIIEVIPSPPPPAPRAPRESEYYALKTTTTSENVSELPEVVLVESAVQERQEEESYDDWALRHEVRQAKLARLRAYTMENELKARRLERWLRDDAARAEGKRRQHQEEQTQSLLGLTLMVNILSNMTEEQKKAYLTWLLLRGLT